MIFFVDTSVWSLAFRRDGATKDRRVAALDDALRTRGAVVTTGIVIQELMQGANGPKQRQLLLDKMSSLPCLQPSIEDHLRAAEIGRTCRHNGVQLASIDALLASLCIGYDLTMLTADRDFEHAARHVPLVIWG